MQIQKNKAALAVFLMMLAGFANAAGEGPDFTTLTAGIALGGVITAVLAAALAKVGPTVAMWGATKVLSMIKRG